MSLGLNSNAHKIAVQIYYDNNVPLSIDEIRERLAATGCHPNEFAHPINLMLVDGILRRRQITPYLGAKAVEKYVVTKRGKAWLTHLSQKNDRQKRGVSDG